MKLEAALDAYLEHLRSERQLSSHTLIGYRHDLSTLLAFCTQEQIDSWAALDTARLRRMVGRLNMQGQSSRSLARLLSATRGLYRFLIREGHCQSDPASGLSPPKGERRLPRTLDTDRAAQLLDGALEDDFIARRDQAMLELFYSSGLRLSELCALRWRDLDLADGLVTVLGKGSKQRSVPLGSFARTALHEWRASTGATSDAPVFPGRGGGPITSRAVQLRLRQLAQRQGLFKHVHPHMLRHSFASHILESSGDLRGVQELLGHADIATTQIYTHLDFQHLAKVYDAAHPRARWKKPGG